MAVINETDELKEVIASAWTEFSEVEVVKLSYSAWDQDLFLTSQLDTGFIITDSNGPQSVTYVPMKLSDESNDELVANTRELSLQGINDIVAFYEDQTEQSSSEKIAVDVYSYLLNRDGTISKIQSSFRYFVQSVSYSQKNNSATLRISTSQTNNSETGIKFNSSVFPSLRGVEI